MRNIRGDGPYLDASGWDPHHDAEGYKPIEIDGVSYDKGVAWFGNHGQVSWLEWSLPGQQQRVRFVVRIDDEKYGRYEWGLVARSSGEVILGAAKARPLLPGGDPETGEKGDFRAPEEDAYGPNEALVRIGAGGKLRIFGDGALLHETTEFYAYGAGVAVDLDVSGVELLRISFVPRHHEQAAAPHRKGLTITPFLVQSSFFDIVDLAAAQVCE